MEIIEVQAADSWVKTAAEKFERTLRNFGEEPSSLTAIWIVYKHVYGEFLVLRLHSLRSSVRFSSPSFASVLLVFLGHFVIYRTLKSMFTSSSYIVRR